jgi:glucosamine 6-phosphate synthetase-like amidotransferase/phosphosugar isomerase protein
MLTHIHTLTFAHTYTRAHTQVIANLIAFYQREKNNTPDGLLESVKQALQRLDGTWGLAIIHKGMCV